LAFSLLLLVISSYAHVPAFTSPPCKVDASIDGSYNEVFDFTAWKGKALSVVVDNTEGGFPDVPPYHNWTYTVDFCRSTTAFMGDGTQHTSLGWSYGRLFKFNYNNTPHPIGATSLQFYQEHTDGDFGAPCSTPRASRVNIWCGKSCARVPGSKSDQCLTSDATTPYCVCSVQVNNAVNTPFCTGLVFNLLSTSCPAPTMVPADKNTAGIVFGVLFLLVVVAFVGVYAFNWRRGLRGLEAVPFATTCCPGAASSHSNPSYGAQPVSTPGYSSAISTGGGYQSV